LRYQPMMSPKGTAISKARANPVTERRMLA
jgi:hypothetical protein